MPDLRALAAVYGVRIEVADLGDWGTATLVAEYDPRGPAIRLNVRALRPAGDHASRCAIERAIAHELYHHREASGEVVRLRDHRARERAADAYAESLVTGP
jgi:hypothetical protein